MSNNNSRDDVDAVLGAASFDDSQMKRCRKCEELTKKNEWAQVGPTGYDSGQKLMIATMMKCPKCGLVQ